MVKKELKDFSETQLKVLITLENRVIINSFTPIQALTMELSYFKGGYYEGMDDSDFEPVVKAFVVEYM